MVLEQTYFIQLSSPKVCVFKESNLTVSFGTFFEVVQVVKKLFVHISYFCLLLQDQSGGTRSSGVPNDQFILGDDYAAKVHIIPFMI